MTGWALVIIGLVVAVYAFAFGVATWEVTIAIGILGLLVAVAGAFMLVRARRAV